MSKVIKQMQMDAIKQTFEGVRDMVVLSVSGLNATADHALRATLRKKNVRMVVVKNSLVRRVFNEVGINIPADSPYWSGPTTFVFGAPGTSIGEVSRVVEGELKNPKLMATYKDKVKVKGAVAEGAPVTFDLAVKMPTRLEAIGQVLQAILSGGSNIAGCLTGPAGQVASQIKTISEKKEDAAPAATAS
jgi:large subunit ribosomal protein L10